MAQKPEPRNYTLGRGRVYFARYEDPTNLVQDPMYRYVGNTPEVNMTIESEELDHYSSDDGIREKDQSVALEVNRTGTMVCDDIQSENLALFFFGSTSQVSTAASAGLSENFDAIFKGSSIKLGVTAQNPVGYMGVENVSVTSNPIGTTFVEGTDYVVDVESGLVDILLTGSIPDASNIIINYDVRSSTRTRIISGATAVEGAMMVRQRNPTGIDRVLTMPLVKVTPNGDFALKGDEWQQIPFSLEFLKPGDARDAIYLDGMPLHV